MNKLILIAAAAMIASSPAMAQTTAPAEPAPSALASLGSASDSVSSGTTWSQLDATSRYLLIMGSADGFSAGGAGSPCFPGKDNASLDQALTDAGFADKDPADLATALQALSAPAKDCTQVSRRGYTMGLLKGMPDKHLATYLTGLVHAYAMVKSCPKPAQTYAAAAVTAAILSSSDDAQLHQVIPDSLAEGCKGPPR